MSTIDPQRMDDLLVAARALDRRLRVRVPRQKRGLAARIAHGDLHALADLCDGVAQDLFDYANYRLDDVVTAKKVVRDICQTAKSRRHELHTVHYSTTVWLMRIARERMQDIYGIDYTVEVTLASSHPACQTLEQIKRLDAELQECTMLRTVLRFSAADVALIMGHSLEEQLIMQGNALATIYAMAA